MQFSVQTQAFYGAGLNFGDALPSDAVSITEDQANKFYKAVNSGCYIYLTDGVLTASEARPDNYHSWDSENNTWILTDGAAEQQKQDQIASAENEKENRVNAALQDISVLQLKLQAGRTLTSDETTRLNTVLDYIDAVTAIDTSTAPDITWPTEPGSSS
ncbi:tail fiber assembly protein [Mangrovibacter sp. SLW1]